MYYEEIENDIVLWKILHSLNGWYFRYRFEHSFNPKTTMLCKYFYFQLEEILVSHISELF